MGSAMLLVPLTLLCLAMYLSKHMVRPDAGGVEGDQAHHNRGYQDTEDQPSCRELQ